MDPKEVAKKVLGPKSYPAIVEQIVERIRDAQANTMAGADYLRKVYEKLNESETPMMEIKQFITGAEEVAKDDAELSAIIDFCKQAATTADLNCLINVCKEEHLLNLKKSGHPNPEATIKELESEFNQNVSVIEKGIREGIFDKLNSKLLNDIKAGLGIEVNTAVTLNLKDKLFENDYQSNFGGVCKYTPIGIVAETLDNRTVLLTESDILSYDKEHEVYSKLNENETLPLIKKEYKRLMEAVTSANYDPSTKIFSLTESWDFHLELKDGVCRVGMYKENMKTIDSKDLSKMLFESLNLYETGNVEVPNFNRDRFLKDADNIMYLMENADLIVEFDDLKVIRNLNENRYCLMDVRNIKETNTPNILSIDGKCSESFKSFTSLCETMNIELHLKDTGFKMHSLFEHQLENEMDLINTRNNKLTELLEEQQELNNGIEKVRNLKKLADENSPTMDKLNEREELLNKQLSENIDSVNFYRNEFKLF